MATKRLPPIIGRDSVDTVQYAITHVSRCSRSGIPDFRGQRGVWTLEEQGEPLPKYERCWDNAVPTLGHMALVGLVNAGLLHGIISQNVDGESTSRLGGAATAKFSSIFGRWYTHAVVLQCAVTRPYLLNKVAARY